MFTEYEMIVAIKKEVDDNPFHYVDPNSRPAESFIYVFEGKPICLIGRVLVNSFQVPQDFFLKSDVLGFHTQGRTTYRNTRAIAYLWDSLAQDGFEFDYGARMFARDVQELQDQGTVWDVAYKLVMERKPFLNPQ